MFTADQILYIMPQAGKTRATGYAPLLSDAMDEFGILTPMQQAMWLANVAHESGQLIYVEEIASGAAYDGRDDLGNTRPEAISIAAKAGTTPGRFYKGHGLIQITGFDNHVECGHALGIDAKNEPQRLTLPVYAARSAAWFWQRHQINQYADSGDFDGACDMVNRGRKTVRYGDTNGFAQRLAFFEAAKEVLCRP